MEITLRHTEKAEIVDIQGILDTGTSAKAEAFINELLLEKPANVVINLEGTDYLSSSGLRILLATAKKLWATEGKFKICHPNKIIRDILETSGFTMILDVRDTEEEALTEL